MLNQSTASSDIPQVENRDHIRWSILKSRILRSWSLCKLKDYAKEKNPLQIWSSVRYLNVDLKKNDHDLECMPPASRSDRGNIRSTPGGSNNASLHKTVIRRHDHQRITYNLIKVAGTNTEEAITATSNVRLCIQIQGGVPSFDVDSWLLWNMACSEGGYGGPKWD